MQPWGIATNSSGHFIIADYEDRDVKVLDCNGILRNQFSPPNDCRSTKFHVHDVATNMYDNIYALFEKRKTGNCGFEGEGVICVFNTAGLYHKFPMRKGECYRLSVNDSHKFKALVLGDEPGDWRVIDVYEADGQFVRSIGEEPEKDRLCVLIHTKDGEFVRSSHIREEDFAYFTTGVTVTIEGRIAVALQHLFEQGKVLVL